MISRLPEEVSEVRLVDLAAAEKAHLHDPQSRVPTAPAPPACSRRRKSRAKPGRQRVAGWSKSRRRRHSCQDNGHGESRPTFCVSCCRRQEAFGYGSSSSTRLGLSALLLNMAWTGSHAVWQRLRHSDNHKRDGAWLATATTDSCQGLGGRSPDVSGISSVAGPDVGAASLKPQT